MSEITNAMRQLCEDKGLSYETVLEAIEMSLAAAYRKDYGVKNQNIKTKFNPDSGKIEVWDEKIVVEDMPEEEIEEEGEEKEKKSEEAPKNEVLAEGEEISEEKKFNPKTEIQITDALLLKPDAKVGDEIRIDLESHSDFGRMAAQTAKQVIIQKLREAERGMIMSDFKEKEGTVVIGTIQRQEGRFVLVDLGKVAGILSREEQIRSEFYQTGKRIKVYIKEVREGYRGLEVILSRSSAEIVKQVFENEIPEIANELITIKGVAREAGFRSKVAVLAEAEHIDPIGSCVGQRGSRIQTIINELGGEKIDIIQYDEDPAKFIINALSPAKIINVDVNLETRRAVVKVADDQQSLAIGRGGQNVRLASQLTGWNLDIVGHDGKSIAENEKEENIATEIDDKENKEKIENEL